MYVYDFDAGDLIDFAQRWSRLGDAVTSQIATVVDDPVNADDISAPHDLRIVRGRLLGRPRPPRRVLGADLLDSKDALPDRAGRLLEAERLAAVATAARCRRSQRVASRRKGSPCGTKRDREQLDIVVGGPAERAEDALVGFFAWTQQRSASTWGTSRIPSA